MWSPRRLLLMVFSFALFLGAYQLYAFFLGHYDGLPPLPPEYRSTANGQVNISDNSERYVNRKHEINRMLERAFGPKCQEISRSRSFEIGPPDSRTVFAFDEWSLENGVLRMSNISLANFKKLGAEPGKPAREEILTLQGTEAFITFNQPVKNLYDIKPNLKPTMGHILGKSITLTHNHGTPEAQDDIRIYCEKRIDFVDAQRRIWCDGYVQAVYAEPPEARFVGTGLEITLNTELVARAEEKNQKNSKKEAPLPSAPAEKGSMGISSVKSITLEKDVEFSFMKLSGSLLGGPVGKPDDKKADAAQQQVLPMVISCKESFSYDVQNHIAVFNSKVNASRHRMVQIGTTSKLQSDELHADERLTLELMPPVAKPKTNTKPAGGVEEEMQQFELKRAVATGKKVKIIANEDGLGNGLKAEGIEFICDNVAHEARLRGKDEVVATLAQYDIITQGIIKILLPIKGADDKDPRGLMINGPGEIKLRATAQQPDPYTLASWQRELQWHRTTQEHRIELYGSAVLMHDKMGRMAGEQVKAWLHQEDKTKEPKKPNQQNGLGMTGLDRLDALKRVEVDQRVSVVSSRFMIPQANRLTLNFTTAPADFVLNKAQDGFGVPQPAQDAKPNLLGKPETKTTPAPSTPPMYIQANEIDGEILIVGEKQQVLRRLEAREQVHIERKTEPGKQNGIEIHGQRVEMTMQHSNDLYRIKLYGNKANVNYANNVLEGQVIDLDQAENTVSIPGPGKFSFYTDRDFQGNTLKQAEQVNFNWTTSMRFGGRAAEFTGNVLAEKGEITLSCHSMTITLDRTMSLSGKSEKIQEPQMAAGFESVICTSNTQENGGRTNPVVIEQRIKPGTPERHIVRIEGIQVLFDNSQKKQEIIKVYGPGEINMVRSGKNQLFDMNQNTPAPGAVKPAAQSPSVMMLERIIFEQEAEFRSADGKINFWRNVKMFKVPGDDIGMPLDEKRLPKNGIYIASDRFEANIKQGANNTTLQEAQARGNAEMRMNQSSYVKADLMSYTEEKGQIVMEGLSGNDALAYNQDSPGAPYRIQRAKGFIFFQKTNELRVIDGKSMQIK
jgi:lipopolysaccharide export system protein LptA